MKNLKKILVVGLLLALTGCGTTTATEDAENDKVIKIGASSTPHAEILENIRLDIEAEGYELEIVVFDDYVLPNEALANGELDANYFQHLPYLENYNENKGTTLVSAAAVHFEPLGIYAGSSATIEDLEDGAIIGIPSDATNGARALRLLEANGVINIDDNKDDLNITTLDIVDNPLNVDIKQITAAQLPRTIEDFSLAVINGNYALQGDILDRLITTEDSSSFAAIEYANIIAVQSGDEDSEKIQALIKALCTDKTTKFVEEKYNGTVVTVY